MRFGGIHKAKVFGIPATNTKIEWSAAAFFQTDEKQILSLWVLGDVDHIKVQLGNKAAGAFG